MYNNNTIRKFDNYIMNFGHEDHTMKKNRYRSIGM